MVTETGPGIIETKPFLFCGGSCKLEIRLSSELLQAQPLNRTRATTASFFFGERASRDVSTL